MGCEFAPNCKSAYRNCESCNCKECDGPFRRRPIGLDSIKIYATGIWDANLLLIVKVHIATVKVVIARNATVHLGGSKLSLGFKKHGLDWSNKQLID